MVKQYPHTLKVKGVGEATHGSNGNWTPVPGTTTEKACRAEPNGGGFITTIDGVRIDFSWVVYLPLPVNRVSEGSRVEVWDGEEKIATDTVKRFSRGQLNARIWL